MSPIKAPSTSPQGWKPPSASSKILPEINNQELTQYQKMAEANKQAAIFTAKSTIQLGTDRFNEYLAQGLGGLVGGLTTGGTMAYGHFANSYKSQFKQLEQKQKGIQNYQKAVQRDKPRLAPNSPIAKTPHIYA